MSAEPNTPRGANSVEMPAPTVAPLVLSVGIALAAIGVATNLAFSVVGFVLFVAGLGLWIGQLLPGRGHVEEPLVDAPLRARPIAAAPGAVEHIRPGMPGYRLRLPERLHPISAGIKGGIAGGLVMPLPAIIYCMARGYRIWLPVNLLAGMVLPGVEGLNLEELQQFNTTLFAFGLGIHVCVSLILGLIYGVLMPMLPRIPKPLAWGALLMPALWTAASFVGLGVANPAVRAMVDWPWFVVSQFIFGLAAASVFMAWERRGPIVAGLVGGVAGGILMSMPAVLWSLLTRHGAWYPINLLAALVVRHPGEITVAQLEPYNPDWLATAIVTHGVLSLGFGLAFAIVLPLVPRIAAPLLWGGLVMPLLWTASSYGMMGIVNPALQENVDWPWFVASQFVFGVVAAIVIVRSEQITVAPAGSGPDRRIR